MRSESCAQTSPPHTFRKVASISCCCHAVRLLTKDGCAVYIPVRNLETRAEEHIVSSRSSACDQLRQGVENRIGTQKLANGRNACERLDEELLDIQRGYNDDRVYQDSEIPDKLWVLIQVVKSCNDSAVSLNQYYTAEVYANALTSLRNTDLVETLVTKNALSCSRTLTEPGR